ISRCARGGTDGLSRTMVSGRAGGAGRAGLRASAAAAYQHTAAGEFADVLRARHAELDAPPAAALSALVRSAICVVVAGGAGICESVCATVRCGCERPAA